MAQKGDLQGVVKSHPTSASETCASETRLSVTRRGFLSGFGALVAGLGTGGLGTAAAASIAAEAAPAAAAGPPPFRPRIGALYEPGFRHDHGWQGIREVPAAGRYSSSDGGVLDTHLALAKTYGLDFFLVSYRHDPERSQEWRNISQLFSRADRDHLVKIAILIDADAESAALAQGLTTRRLSSADYVRGLSLWLAARYDAVAKERGWLTRASSLRETDGRKILAFAAEGRPALIAAALEELYAARPEIAESTRIWYAGAQDAQDSSRRLHGLLAGRGSWFLRSPLVQGGWSETLSLYESLGASFDRRVISVSPSFLQTENGVRVAALPRDDGRRLQRQLQAIRRLDQPPHYVVVNSFNDWRTASTVEPKARQRPIHLEALCEWKKSWA